LDRRSFLEDWIAAYEVHERRLEELHDLGNGVTFAVALLHGRLAGSDATVQERWCYTSPWEAGLHLADDHSSRHRRGPRCRRTARWGARV